MHELSIVQSVVSTVSEWISQQKPGRVLAVTLVVGELSGVVEDSLQFGWEIATEGSALAGARLAVRRQPVVIHCPQCNELSELASVQSFRCARCGTPSGDVRHGKELEIESVEFEESASDGENR